ncbi:hypothetical protein F5B21DRAFT_238027 [Xylaria acuta]|nr:hypothetical protein F5B21DRAFT_238027 [Xylaria acuta]
MGNVGSTNMNTYSLQYDDEYDDEYDDQYDDMATSTTGFRQCISCLEEKPTTEYKSATPRCRREHGPGMCTQCVTMWIRRSVDEQGTRITCPQCPLELDYFEIEEAADEATFRRYETLVLFRLLEEDTHFEWCAHACGSGQLHPAAVDEPIMTCHHCNKRTCVVHQLPWHSGVTCRQFDGLLGRGRRGRDKGAASLRFQEQQLEEQSAQAALEAAIQTARDERASQEEVRRTSKSCPKCKFDIQKIGGCDKMTCRRCAHVFCWLCLAPYSSINTSGNSAHRRDCAWYRY